MNDDTVIELTPDPTPKPPGPSESLQPDAVRQRHNGPVPGHARPNAGLQPPIPPTTKPTKPRGDQP